MVSVSANEKVCYSLGSLLDMYPPVSFLGLHSMFVHELIHAIACSIDICLFLQGHAIHMLKMWLLSYRYFSV